MLDWSTLLTALALVFVIEGLLLFASPDTMKKVYAEAANQDQKKLRFFGLGAIIAGLILLNLNR